MRDASRISLWRGLRTIAVLGTALVLAGCNAMNGGNGEPTANRAPVPRIVDAVGTVDPSSLTIRACQNLTLNASSSTDEDNDTITYSWDFGDESDLVTTAEASHQFLAAGEYTITLTVADGRGLATSTATRTLTVTVEDALTAAFTYTPITGQAPLEVSFDGSGSSDCGGTIASYSWDFNDDATEDASTQSATFTFEEGGTYDVTLTVTDNDGNTASDVNQVVVGAAPPDPVAPTVNATASIITADIGEVITFTATADDPDGEETALTYLWDFGDNSTDATTAVATHGYAAEGVYTATVTVTDAQTLSATDTVQITVAPANEAPEAVISAEVVDGTVVTDDPIRGLAPLSVDFDGLSSTDDTGIFGYCWYFEPNTLPPVIEGSNFEACEDSRSGDSLDPTQDIAPIVFDVAGEYPVYLYVTDTASPQVRSELVSETIEVRTVTSLAAGVTDVLLAPLGTQQLLVTGTLNEPFSDDNDTAALDITSDVNTIYTSSDTLVATVSATGLITAVADGAATITIDRVPALTAPFVVNVVVGTPLSAVVATADATVVAPSDTITLTATPTGGIVPLTYAWTIVQDPDLSTATLVDGDMAEATFVPVEEGIYVFNCTVTDSSATPVEITSDPVTVIVTSMTAAFDRTDDHELDTCAVAPLGLTPPTANGADAPPTPVGTPELELALTALITGGSGNFTYEWSVSPNLGLLVDGALENEVIWQYPTVPVAERTPVFITVTVTDVDTLAVVDFTYDVNTSTEEVDPFIVVASPLLTDICIGSDVPACPAAPLDQIDTNGALTTVQVTFHLDQATGNYDDVADVWTTQWQLTEMTDPDGAATVEAACTTATEFGIDPFVTCDIEFLGTADSVYEFRIRMRETCDGDITGTGNLVPRVDNFFTLEVSDF